MQDISRNSTPEAEAESFFARLPLWARYRRRAALNVVDSFFVYLTSVSRYQPYAKAKRHGVELVRDVAYAESGLDSHRLDVYRPLAPPGPLPIVLYVHGGGFRILSKDSHWLMALLFARRGYLVFNVNYRLAPDDKYPAAVEDVCAAYRWVVENAESFGGDLSRLVLAGESAGANLVTALTVATSFVRPEPWARAVFDTGVQPKVVLPACGIFQVSDVDRLEHSGPLATFVREYLKVISEAYLPPEHERRASLDLADPLVLLERDTPSDRPLPPFFNIVGSRDPLLDDTRRLTAALQRRGVDVTTRYYEGEPHAFHAFVWRRAARQSWRDTFDYLGPRIYGAAGTPAARAVAPQEEARHARIVATAVDR